jgi:hypothetical protein
MQSVPAPPRVVSHRSGVAALLAALATAVVIVAAALSSSGPVAHSRASSYHGLIGGVPLQTARCIQWNSGSEGERSDVVAALAHSVGGGSTYGRGTTLPASDARALFDRACSNPIAQNWLLYELYIRAAGFRSYTVPQT